MSFVHTSVQSYVNTKWNIFITKEKLVSFIKSVAFTMYSYVISDHN
jgi:hypothetical protein